MTMKIRDRIKELRRVRACDLRPHPKNWRTHPQAQQDALRAVLEEVGIAGAVLARECEDGTLMLIDGHLRADTSPETEWPVLVLDVTESEAEKLLATFDPLTALAGVDAAKLECLLHDIETDSPAIQGMFDAMAQDASIFSPAFEPSSGTEKSSGEKEKHTCPSCGHEF